jgi:hypothetical protein
MTNHDAAMTDSVPFAAGKGCLQQLILNRFTIKYRVSWINHFWQHYPIAV